MAVQSVAVQSVIDSRLSTGVLRELLGLSAIALLACVVTDESAETDSDAEIVTISEY